MKRTATKKLFHAIVVIGMATAACSSDSPAPVDASSDDAMGKDSGSIADASKDVTTSPDTGMSPDAGGDAFVGWLGC